MLVGFWHPGPGLALRALSYRAGPRAGEGQQCWPGQVQPVRVRDVCAGWDGASRGFQSGGTARTASVRTAKSAGTQPCSVPRGRMNLHCCVITGKLQQAANNKWECS